MHTTMQRKQGRLGDIMSEHEWTECVHGILLAKRCLECENAALKARVEHWQKLSGFDTPEELIDATDERELWLLEQRDRKKADARVKELERNQVTEVQTDKVVRLWERAELAE